MPSTDENIFEAPTSPHPPNGHPVPRSAGESGHEIPAAALFEAPTVDEFGGLTAGRSEAGRETDDLPEPPDARFAADEFVTRRRSASRRTRHWPSRGLVRQLGIGAICAVVAFLLASAATSLLHGHAAGRQVTSQRATATDGRPRSQRPLARPMIRRPPAARPPARRARRARLARHARQVRHGRPRPRPARRAVGASRTSEGGSGAMSSPPAEAPAASPVSGPPPAAAPPAPVHAAPTTAPTPAPPSPPSEFGFER
jgi:hypothetical protein